MLQFWPGNLNPQSLAVLSEARVNPPRDEFRRLDAVRAAGYFGPRSDSGRPPVFNRTIGPCRDTFAKEVARLIVLWVPRGVVLILSGLSPSRSTLWRTKGRARARTTHLVAAGCRRPAGAPSFGLTSIVAKARPSMAARHVAAEAARDSAVATGSRHLWRRIVNPFHCGARAAGVDVAPALAAPA